MRGSAAFRAAVAPGGVLLPLVRDPDARDYIRRVEAADGEPLEPLVRRAIDAFVRGCKNDGNWPAIKASCIMAGARTLAGALTPLVGATPTNFNFVAGDYNRKTGLKGDGSTKYLDSNRNNNAEPQDNKHVSVYLTEPHSGTTSGIHLGTNISSTPGTTQLTSTVSNNTFTTSVNNTGVASIAGLGSSIGMFASTRSSSASFFARFNNSTTTQNFSSNTPDNITTFIFCRNGNTLFSNARLAFYSIGENLALARLDPRVTDLINAIGAALP